MLYLRFTFRPADNYHHSGRRVS